jgi:hypothetical protein
MEQDLYAKLGLARPADVKRMAEERVPWLIENLLLRPSINIFAGHSGLGKSAFCAQMGMCIVSGKDFFGYQVFDQGPVVYCDAESTPAMMGPMQEALAEHLGLSKVPDDFVMWNPNWKLDPDKKIVAANKVRLYEVVRQVKPRLVILDSLRNFFPLAIKEQDAASNMIAEMRKVGGNVDTSWLLVHHLRKTNREDRANNTRPQIRVSPQEYMEEATGTFALINNTDTRIGWEVDRAHNIWFGGFLRLFGEIGPFKIIRELDEEGEPLGYRMGDPVEQLPADMQALFGQIPMGEEFSFNHLVDNLRRSRSTASRFIRRCMGLGLLRIVREVPREGGGRPLKMYIKVMEEVTNGEDKG